MSVEMAVYCDCVETGQLTIPHPYPDYLYIEEAGCPELRPADSTIADAHHNWLQSKPCQHDGFFPVLHGWNIYGMAVLRDIMKTLTRDPATEYPTIWSRVIYSGTICGDILYPKDVAALKVEIDYLEYYGLSELHPDEKVAFIRFLEQLNEQVTASQSVGKPISR
jgi:hypothetical protein